MSTIAEIEQAIQQLSPTDRADLFERIDESRFLRESTRAMFQLLDDEEENDDDSQSLGNLDEDVA